MRQKFLFIHSAVFLFFLFSCGKENVLEDKVEVSVIKGRISDGISFNDSIDIKNSSRESEEAVKLNSSDSEIGRYIFALNGKDDHGVINDGAARLSLYVFPTPTAPPLPFQPESAYLPFVKLGKNGSWFSNTGQFTRNNIVLLKTNLTIIPLINEVPKMLMYCSFVYNGYFYQFKNYPIASQAGTSNLYGPFTQYTVQAFKSVNLPYGLTPVWKTTPAHYDASGNFITGGQECVQNCGSPAADWQVGTVNITSVGLNAQDRFTMAGTLTVQGTTVPFDLAQYYRVPE